MVIAAASHRHKVAFVTSHPTTIPTRKTKGRMRGVGDVGVAPAVVQEDSAKCAARFRGAVALRVTHSSEERSCISDLPVVEGSGRFSEGEGASIT